MSLLLLLRNHQGAAAPPAPGGEDDRHHVGGELLWPAQGVHVPAKPNIPIRLVGKPKKVVTEIEDEDDLLRLGGFDD